MEENRRIVMKNIPLVPEKYSEVRAGIVELLKAARTASVRSVNALMTATYWEIGRRIVEFEQEGQERAGYGEALITQLVDDLTGQFGRGFGAVNLSQMRRFYLAWASPQIFQTPSEKSSSLPELAARFPLPWSAYVRLLSVKSPEARSFMKPRLCARDGLSGNWIARSAANSTNASRSQRTKRPCWRRRRTPNPAMR